MRINSAYGAYNISNKPIYDITFFFSCQEKRRKKSGGRNIFFKKGIDKMAKRCYNVLAVWKTYGRIYAGMAELADARDLKSREIYFSYRFDPGFRHHHIAEWSSLVARRAHNPKVMRFKSHLRNQRFVEKRTFFFFPLGEKKVAMMGFEPHELRSMT